MSSIKTVIEAMRIKAWTKNSFVFAALLFSRLWSLEPFAGTFLAMIGFGLVSSAVYLINDSVDRERDRLHPEKKNRPIASGRLSVPTALTIAFLLSVSTLTLAWLTAPRLALVYSVYFLMQLAYSFRLKKVVILDCLIISLGFVFRAVAGVAVLYDTGETISLSPWLVICTFFLASLMAFSKRRHELSSMGESAHEHRDILRDYSLPLLDQIIGVCASASILGYSIYTVSGRTESVVSPYMWVTIPFVAYGVFRYLFVVYHTDLGGAPDKVLLRDGPLKLDLLLWVSTVILVLFMGHSS